MLLFLFKQFSFIDYVDNYYSAHFYDDHPFIFFKYVNSSFKIMQQSNCIPLTNILTGSNDVYEFTINEISSIYIEETLYIHDQ